MREVLTSDDRWVFNDLGMLLRRQGLWNDAKKNNRMALTVPSGDAGLSYTIGVAYADDKEYDAALAYFEKALEAEQELIKQAPPVGYTIVTDHHRCRNLSEARNFLLAVLELDPNYEPASRLLGPLAS